MTQVYLGEVKSVFYRRQERQLEVRDEKECFPLRDFQIK